MIVYGQWHGGGSYAAPYVEHTERFESQTAAVDACRDWYDNRDGSTPCVDESSGMALFLTDPRETGEEYPDRLIIRTDRGAWRVTGC